MAINLIMPLTNSRGLGKVIFFSGLEFPVAITPSLFGEPMITSQAFYFLERLDSVARMQFEHPDKPPSEREIEFIIDNYLFEYSKRYPDSKITSKITEFVFWRPNTEDHYSQYDWQLTECLVLDPMNDTSIVEYKDENHPNKDHVYDWCLFKPPFEKAFSEYQEKLKNAMSVRAMVKTKDHSSLGTGKFELPILKVKGRLLTLEQVEMLEVIKPGRQKPDSTDYVVSRGMQSDSNFSMPQELITASSYHDEQLLAYYFSAIKDSSPVSQFKNYYNVIEYFFEHAPEVLGLVAKFEKDQIQAVLRWAVTPAELLQKVSSLPTPTIAKITKSQVTSSGEVVPGVNLSAADFIGEYAIHVYQLRNACIHSKKTRKGVVTPRIVPATTEENILAGEMPVMQWLAVKCIEKK